MNSDMFLSAKQMATRLGLHHARVYELASSGAIPTVRFVRRIMFPRDGLEALSRAAIERALERQTTQK